MTARAVDRSKCSLDEDAGKWWDEREARMRDWLRRD